MHFIFDANMPKRLAEGIGKLDQQNISGVIKIVTSHADDLLGPSATDEEIILKASEIDAIILSEDDDFKRIKTNKALIKKLKVGYVLYKPPKHGSRYWEKAVAFILAWENLKAKVKATYKPFIFKINKSGEITEEIF